MLVKEIMTKEVVTIRPEATLAEVVKLLKQYRINGVPVVTVGGVLVGIITMSDLLRLLRDINFWNKVEQVKPELSVKDAFLKDKEQAIVEKKMTHGVITVTEDESVERVLDLMSTRNIHTIPVMRDDKLVGIVGAMDIVSLNFLPR
ncbi:MAG: CBS domain-containing protein [Candidatus Omnitrophota bacterium]